MNNEVLNTNINHNYFNVITCVLNTGEMSFQLYLVLFFITLYFTVSQRKEDISDDFLSTPNMEDTQNTSDNWERQSVVCLHVPNSFEIYFLCNVLNRC